MQDHRNKVTRRFTATIIGDWQDNQGVLDETFYFADGKVEKRCWRLTKQGDKLTGTAGDVIGTAKGQVQGNTLNWQYTLKAQTDNGQVKLKLDDWLYLVDEYNLINRTKMFFWSFPVGEVTLHIAKLKKPKTTQTSADCRLK
nr:DUF3833 family protein [Saccharobesus litoralis]